MRVRPARWGGRDAGKQPGGSPAGIARKGKVMAIDTDDLEPTVKPAANLVGKPDMELMSVDELQNYIADLQSEIDRANQAIGAKQNHRSGAEALFKS